MPKQKTTPIALANKPAKKEAPTRRCMATGELLPQSDLLRFVHAPDGTVVFDVTGKLPGRGYYLTPSKSLLAQAIKKRRFSHKASGAVVVPEHLPEKVEEGLLRHVQNQLGLARKSGELVLGFDTVQRALKGGKLAMLFCASDAADNAVQKMGSVPKEVVYIDKLGRDVLAQAVGANNLVHLGVKSVIVARKLERSVQRYLGFIGS